ncbi:uncharacterized protein LOC114174329 isoform X3 [Vigna unguiculata]|uniref:uncharacterized protein LOC114174329 isoform X3 n=1 Tax=Vigna unguiculata TaxID=3917 RepID=UPI001016D7A2|nr:uncharacterized protein LOC114174329 isoform X3 [Vigna unguiculata]
MPEFQFVELKTMKKKKRTRGFPRNFTTYRQMELCIRKRCNWLNVQCLLHSPNYFSCFFSLPIVISSMRWGVDAGRKTLVATTILLLVLSGPVKALTYLLKHGIVGFTMGTLWRLGASWNLSIFLCTIVRAVGAVGFVLISSFLIRENILALITINIHASLTFVLTASGVNSIPSMNVIYTLFGILVLINSGCFMFLLHLLYSVFLTRIGMKSSLRLPRWLEKAI